MSQRKKIRNKRKMEEAMSRLNQEGIIPTRPTDHLIKIGEVNFYPGKGTIYLDGDDGKLKEKGLDALINLLNKDNNVISINSQG